MKAFQMGMECSLCQSLHFYIAIIGHRQSRVKALPFNAGCSVRDVGGRPGFRLRT